MHQKRKAFSQQNTTFELYKRRFYRNLEDVKVAEHQVGVTEIKEFCKIILAKR